MEIRPDFKQPKRIRDPEASRRKLLQEPLCRNCRKQATDGHHILLRSQGGDDVEDNILPVCHQCHRDFHDARLELRVTLDERLYVLTKLGQNPGTVYLERRNYV